ncbi:MAG: hypothetical protein ACREV3_02480, partial [Gammaproteobacteria bacterium]
MGKGARRGKPGRVFHRKRPAAGALSTNPQPCYLLGSGLTVRHARPEADPDDPRTWSWVEASVWT